MKLTSYFYLVYSNIPIFILSCVICTIWYLIFYKRYYISIIDPFFLSTFFSCIASSSVVFLFIIDKIEQDIFVYWFLSQILFMIGFIIFKPIKFYNTNKNLKILTKDFHIILVFILIINIFLFTIFFYLNGIPLFSSGSRLDIYFGSNLSKIITRLCKFFLDILLILTAMCFFIKANKSLKYINLIFAAMVLLFLGSKASIINILNAFFVVSLYLAKFGKIKYLNIIKKSAIKFILIGLAFALLVISITETHASAFGFLVYRIIATADSFCMTLPYKTIDVFINRDNWFINLFGSPLRMVGLISIDQVPPVLGTEVSSYHSGSQMFTGPNPRHPLLGYVYFKYNLGLLFSFILGATCGFLRNKVIKYFSFSTLGLIGFSFLYKICFSTETDFYFFLANIINFFTLYFTLYIFFYILKKISCIDIPT